MEELAIIKTEQVIPSRKLVAAYNLDIPLSDAARYFIDSLTSKL
jgi:hypothetical protein